MRVLLCNHFLRDFTGSEVACLDLARSFAKAGHQVEVACFEQGEPMAGLLECDGLAVRGFDELAGQHFDLIWAHHFTTLDHCLLDLAITAQTVVFSSLSPYEPLESPPLCLEQVGLFLANSPETRATLLEMGLPQDRVRLFANPVALEFFLHQPGPLPASPRLALVSNHVPPELKAALPLLTGRGIEVELFGREGRRELITAALLAGFDGIISIGRTVQYGLAMGLPVFCYDHFAGPGWLTPENIERAARHNFSGRCTPEPRSAAKLAEAIAGGLEQAHQQAGGFRELARERYNLKNQLTAVLAEANGRQGVIAGVDCMRAVALRQRDYYRRQQHRPLRACLYADVGEGFDEHFTLWHDMAPPYSLVEFRLSPSATGLQGPLQALRLDPLDAPCVVRLHRLELVVNGRREDVTGRVTANALHREERLYYFLTRDPQLVVPLDGVEVQWLEATLEFVALGDEAVAACLEWLGLERLDQRVHELDGELQHIRAHPMWRFLRLLRRVRDRTAGLFTAAGRQQRGQQDK